MELTIVERWSTESERIVFDVMNESRYVTGGYWKRESAETIVKLFGARAQAQLSTYPDEFYMDSNYIECPRNLLPIGAKRYTGAITF